MRSVNITDLPTGNYSVSVYDDIEDNQPAYQHPEFLKIVEHLLHQLLLFIQVQHVVALL